MLFQKEHLPNSMINSHQGFRKRQRRSEEDCGENEERQSIRNRKEDEDRISELPDSILLHIMSFMDTKSAIKTCVLSKRWKDLCKCLTALTFHSPSKAGFNKFVSWVMSSRDDSYSLLNLTIHCWTEVEALERILRYALLHNVQQLKINTRSRCPRNLEPSPLVFCCKSLTSLEFSNNRWDPCAVSFPKSLHLPLLKSLHLKGVRFIPSDNDCAEPFSNCHMLNTLVLDLCSLHDDAQFLCISNPTLSSLKIKSFIDFKVVLSTPRLTCFTVDGFLSQQLSTTCNLAFLEEVIVNSFLGQCAALIQWLLVLDNVEILTLSSYTFIVLLDDLTYPTSTRSQFPCFRRLKKLKMNKDFETISDDKLYKVVDYLFQKSPPIKFDIVRSA